MSAPLDNASGSTGDDEPHTASRWLQQIRSRRLANRREGWTHASSYRGLSPAAFVHRARLRQLRILLSKQDLPTAGTFLDLGCSDGYIIGEIIARRDLPESWSFEGFDRSVKMLRAAEQRDLSRCHFSRRDLNRPEKMAPEVGDLTICLETLEHVGDLRAALRSIDTAMRTGGTLILSMPNEVGLTGLIKLLSRPLLRTAPYKEVFGDRSAFWRYALHVAGRRDISYLRSDGRKSWGPHLGFDHRAARRMIEEMFGRSSRWVIADETRSAFGSNHFLVIHKRLPTPGSDSGG